MGKEDLFALNGTNIEKFDNQFQSPEGNLDVQKLFKSKTEGPEILKFLDKLSEPEYAFKLVTFEIIDPNKIYQKAIDNAVKIIESIAGDSVKLTTKATNATLEAVGSDERLVRDDDAFENKLKSTADSFNDAANTFDANVVATIVLPLMNAFNESNSHDYEQDNGILSTGFKAINEGISNVNTGTMQIGAGISGKNASSYVPQLPLLDPLKWQNYTGSRLRLFQFAFHLVPRSSSEALNMMRIIYTLKKYSYPKQVSNAGLVLLPPARVRMTFSNPVLQKLVNPDICVISDISITYESSQDISVSMDGIPKRIGITLQLSEFRQKYFDDFENS